MNKAQYDALYMQAVARDRSDRSWPRVIQMTDDELLDLLLSIDIRAVEGWVSR